MEYLTKLVLGIIFAFVVIKIFTSWIKKSRNNAQEFRDMIEKKKDNK